MKKKVFSILFVLVLVCSFSLVAAVPVVAADVDWYVDATGGGDMLTGLADAWADTDNDGVKEAEEPGPFATISKAISSAGAGDTINVAAGTYVEGITIDVENLTLLGAQAGVDPTVEGARTDETAESIINGGINIGADNVTIDGFKVTSNEGDGIIIGTSNHTIKNNYIVSNKANGINFGVDTHGTTIKNNYIASNGESGIESGKKAYDITIENNHITLNEVNGILLKSQNHDIRIEKNTITLNVGRGIWLFGWGSNNPIHHNNIYGNTGVIPEGNTDYGGIEAWSKPGVEVTEVDAANNWWGATNGPSGQGPGDGDAVSENVDFMPWYATETTTPEREYVTVRIGATEDVRAYSDTIQGGINAALAGDTINVAAGTYAENVVIPAGLDNLQLIGAGSDVTSIAPPSGRAVALNGNLGYIDGIKIKGFTLVTVDDAVLAFIAQSGTVGPYTTKDLVLDDIVVDGRIGLYAVDGVTLTNVHISNIGGIKPALWLREAINITFTNGSIEGNDIGVRLSPPDPPYGPNGNIHIHNSNLAGNTFAVENLDSDTEIDATNNWWGHPSGPKHNPGYGDPVSGNVLFNPWLLKLGGETYDKALALNIGWTLVSTDNWISAAKTAGLDVTLAYGYTPEDGWFQATLADLEPVDALYLKTEYGGALGIIYSGGVPVASSKDLEAGWNLISSATIDNAKAILSPLRYVLIGGEQGIGLATLVSQGNFNQHTASLYLSTLTDADWTGLAGHDLNPFDGYWVYMNAGKDFGVVPD
ncbi:hypothetical protein ES708_18498 [subsurface metagenome]